MGLGPLPIRDGHSVDWERLEAEFHSLAGSALEGVYAHGTTREFHLLLDDEFEWVSKMLADATAASGTP